METEKVIAKIIKKNGHIFDGISLTMEYLIFPKPFMSNRELQVDNLVWCHILFDEDSDTFYLEEIAELPLATMEDWDEQENLSVI